MKNIFIYLTIFFGCHSIFSKILHNPVQKKEILLSYLRYGVSSDRKKYFSRAKRVMRCKMEKKNENPDILLLEDIYKTSAVGSDILVAVIEKSEDDGQKSLLSAMVDTCEGFAREAKQRLRHFGIEMKSHGVLERMPSELSVMMSTLTDRSSSQIAQTVIEEAVENVRIFKEKIRNADAEGADINNIRLAGDVLAFHEEIINKMRRYL